MSICVLVSVVEWLIGILIALSTEEPHEGRISVPSKRGLEDSPSSLLNGDFAAVSGRLRAKSMKKESLDTWLKPKIQKTDQNDSRSRRVPVVGRTRLQQGMQHYLIVTLSLTTNLDLAFCTSCENKIYHLTARKYSQPANWGTLQIQAHQNRFQNMSQGIWSHFQPTHHLSPRSKVRSLTKKILQTQIRRLIQLSSPKERGPKSPTLLTRS